MASDPCIYCGHERVAHDDGCIHPVLRVTSIETGKRMRVEQVNERTQWVFDAAAELTVGEKVTQYVGSTGPSGIGAVIERLPDCGCPEYRDEPTEGELMRNVY